MTSLKLLILLLGSSLFLAACDDDYHDDHHHDTTIIITDDDEPALYDFHIIDTYGTNTEFDEYTDLALSPLINAGQFEVFWQVESDVDYHLELRFNDKPSTAGSRLLNAEFCGPYYYCHDHQYQYCDYTNGLNIRCESASGDVQSAYVGDLLYEVPQDMYLILQVCDSGFFYCEYQTIHVSME